MASHQSLPFQITRTAGLALGTTSKTVIARKSLAEFCHIRQLLREMDAPQKCADLIGRIVG